MAVFSFAVCFVLLQVIGVLGEQYDVTVITEPPSGPFLIGNRINFTCHVYPMPSEPATYSWQAVIEASGPSTLSGQRTTQYTPHYTNLHYSWFFCKVFSNESFVGVGRRLVEIHGFVFSVKPLFRTFILGSTIELQVNISNDYSAARLIRTLIWYHNETEIQPLTNRVSVLNDGRKIIIHNTTHSDAGYYKVEIASLNLDWFRDSDCDSVWLPLLRNHAAHAPVTFTLNLLGNEQINIHSSTDHRSYIMENLPLQYYPLVNGDVSTSLTISHDTVLSSSWTYSTVSDIINSDSVSSALSVNGSRFASDASKFNLSLRATESGTFTQVINFQYSTSDEGFYILHLYSDPHLLYRVLRYQEYRCEDHYDYAEDSRSLRLNSISFVIFPFILTTYRSPQVNISSIYLAESGLTQLVCKAFGGVPDSHNITLLHLNQLIATSLGNKLRAYIANDLFWEFTCIVESLYTTKQVSLFWHEKAPFQLLLVTNKKMMCTQLKVNRSAFYEDIKSLFKTICGCSVDLEYMKVDCLMTGNVLLTGTLVYSNSDRNVTASTLIDVLQVWLLTSSDPVVILQQQPFKLINQCPVKLTSATVDVCNNLKVATSGSSESAVIGGSFIGGVLTGILSCLIALCIGLCVLKLKADISMRTAGSTSETSQTVKDEEVVMGTNQAYETVEMRYQSASRYQQPALDPRENISPEPVYENQQHL